MAWRCSALSNAGLINNLAQANIISERVASVMRQVDRAFFVTDSNSSELAYEDAPQSIGHGATISAPHMHAFALENLLPFLNPGARVLDVGSGSGYLSAVLHHLVSRERNPENPAPAGKVVGIDHIDELCKWSVQNLRKAGLGKALDNGSIEIITGDGRQGYTPSAPYSAIHVGAAAPTIPQALIDQLASPGRMFIPVGTMSQDIVQVDKDADGNVTTKELMGVVYVPLTDPDKQIARRF